MKAEPTDDADRERPARSRSLTRLAKRTVVDAIVIALWVLFLTLVFLARVWPRWAYYGLLVLGVLAYTGYTSLSSETKRRRNGRR